MALSGPQKTVMQTVSVVVLMGGLAWASVPFYDWFCRVTGFGGVPGVSAVASDEILDETIKIRFDGSLNNGMAWEFKPVVREMEVRIGETGLAFFEAYNPTDRRAGILQRDALSGRCVLRENRMLLFYRAGACPG